MTNHVHEAHDEPQTDPGTVINDLPADTVRQPRQIPVDFHAAFSRGLNYFASENARIVQQLSISQEEAGELTRLLDAAEARIADLERQLADR